ncbi:hypothetical protein CRT60_24710 [Azospirillum palustre]|uniref:Tyr recombinase domain-containing protein n=1 Tax=Azospirillum palustre TaxID=2044885 RepID=A0A2B8B6E1_9PROT|nr:site-specific integrase [Azospirillum palustre]PGH53118.1 hypothetical protein CRT60_24710 [Azospirillum palustre]
MNVPRHTRLHRRNGTYYLRAAVPEELRPAYGKSEVWKSLRTKDPKEAARLVKVESLKVDQEFEALRKRLDGPAVDISVSEAERLAALHVLDWIEEDEEARMEGLSDHDYRKYAEALDIVEAGNGDALARGDISVIEFEIDEVLDRHSLNIPKGSPGYRRLGFALLKASVRANDLLKARHAGKVVDTPAAPSLPPKGLTMSKLIERYMQDPARAKLSEKTKDGYKVIFRLLTEAIGPEKPVRSISREDCRALRELLVAMPPNATKRFPNATIQEVVEIAKARGLPAISAGSVNSYLNNLSSIFNYAVEEEYMDKNPAKGLQVAENVKKKDKKHPFTMDQLKAIFNAPLYTGCLNDGNGYATRGNVRPRGGRFWVPLLSLFTGMRLNECCQLDVTDVKTLDGVACILIREDSEGAGDDGDRKRVKSEAGERFVPVHPELERLGFLAHVAAMKDKDEKRIFPDLPAGANGYYSDPFSKWFRRFLDKAGAKEGKVSFHSFRHNYRDALREADISRERVRALGGWTDGGGAEDIYGKGLKASTLRAEIEKVSYPDLDLSHLYPGRA